MKRVDRNMSARRAGMGRMGAAALMGLGLLGCDSASGDPSIESIQGALTVGRDFCVFGASGIRLGDRAVVTGLTGAGQSLRAGTDARINGTTLVAGTAALGDRARLTGNLTVSQTLSRGANAVVTGTVRQNTPVTLPALFSQSIPAGTDTVDIGPGLTRTLINGGYGDVIIRSRSTVRLSGTYDVTSFIVEPDVTIIEDPAGSGIQINSVGSIGFGDRVVLTAKDPMGVAIYSNGTTVTLGNQTTVSGIIDAPAATISVGSRSRVNGCAGGARLALDPDASIVSANLNATLPINNGL